MDFNHNIFQTMKFEYNRVKSIIVNLFSKKLSKEK